MIDKLNIRQPTCPWWFLGTFDNPLRRIYQDPFKILAPYLRKGDTAVDLGCGMGYFSIPMAELVGEGGKVIAVDLQPQMLAGLERRAKKAGCDNWVQTHLCEQHRIGVSGPVNFVLALWMVHEVHDSRSFLKQIWTMLDKGGLLLIAEPYLHVSKNRFEQIRSEVLETGFVNLESPSIGFSRSLLLRKG